MPRTSHALARRGCRELPDRKGRGVLDLLMLALLIVGFAAAVLYVRACVSLTQPANGATDQQR
jgi:hypothetical protein